MLTLLIAAALAEAPSTEEPAPGETDEAKEAPPAGSVLLRGARLIDGTGAAPRGADLLVVDGRLAQIGAELDPALAERAVDLGGATVVPGLVDSHVHVTLAPGQYLNDWSRDELDAHLRHHLRAYLAAGVTTVVDCAALWEDLDRVRGWLEAGEPGPRLLALGQPPALPGSYGPAVLPALPTQATPAEVTAHIADLATRDVVGIKVLWESGMTRPVWPLPEGEWLAALEEGARAHGLPLYAHAMDPEETLQALALGPRALLHGLSEPDEDAAAAVAAAGVYVAPTVYMSVAPLAAYHPEQLDDPLLAALAHPDELAARRSPEVRDRSNLGAAEVAAPGLPDWLVRWISGWAGYVEGVAEDRVEATRLLHEAGVPLVLGSDAPGWPVLIDMLPGYSTIRELELLADAGLSPEEALAAGTRLPAEMLGSREFGTLEVGRSADLVVMSGDPLADVGAWRTVQYVMRAGELRTPGGWLEDSF
jgi:imidazolonepropionase-like amidohydrolase